MNHLDIVKRAFHISWRYRPLWLFGFLLALCSGSGGGGGGSSYSPPPESMDGSEYFPPGLPDIDPATVFAVIGGLMCLVLVMVAIGVVVRAVTRTAIIGMVRQVTNIESVTIREGWRLVWSKGAWRLFLVSLVIGMPVAIITIVLVGLAMLPLLLIFTGESGPALVGVAFKIITVFVVMLIVMVVVAIITPIQELSWRYTVLNSRDVFNSIGSALGLIKRNLKDVVIVWLLLIVQVSSDSYLPFVQYSF